MGTKKNTVIRVCHGKKCRHASTRIMDIARKKITSEMTVEQCACLDHCKKGPNIQIVVNGMRRTVSGVTQKKIEMEIDILSGKKSEPVAPQKTAAIDAVNNLLSGGF